MTVNFKSELHPEMNSFLVRLQKALENLPNNPKPECEGFYLAYYNALKNTLTVEKIGIVSVIKEFKYLQFACKKLTQTLFFGAMRSKEFENNDLEQYPGSFIINTEFGPFGVAVSGHDSMIDEAISVLWLIAKRIIEQNLKHKGYRIEDFLYDISIEAKRIQKEFAPDNEWISKISIQMVIDSGGKY